MTVLAGIGALAAPSLEALTFVLWVGPRGATCNPEKPPKQENVLGFKEDDCSTPYRNVAKSTWTKVYPVGIRTSTPPIT